MFNTVVLGKTRCRGCENLLKDSFWGNQAQLKVTVKKKVTVVEQIHSRHSTCSTRYEYYACIC